MKIRKFRMNASVEMFIVIFGFLTCVYAMYSYGISWALEQNFLHRRPTVTCVEGQLYVDKPGGLFEVLDTDGKPLLCSKDAAVPDIDMDGNHYLYGKRIDLPKR